MSKRQKQPLTRYQLIGECTIVQYCQVQYPAKCELPMLTIHRHREDCEGHEIICAVDEIVEAVSADEAIGDKSLSKYEYYPHIPGDREGLEPTWIEGGPIVIELEEDA